MLPPLALRAAFRALPPVEYRRNLFRAVRQKYIATPLSGIGATITGARFTPVGGPETLYVAEEPLTAFTEFHHENLALMRNMDDPFAARLAVVGMVAAHAVLEPLRFLDVTRREVRLAVGTDLNELAAAWRAFPGPGLPPTQVLGEEAYNSGLFQAIRYPSARQADGVCLAIFVDKLPIGGVAYIDVDDTRNGGPKQHIPT